MKKIRPYAGVYKINIHKHTKVRYKMSRWFTELVSDVGINNTGDKHPLVTDISRVPKNVGRIYGVEIAHQDNIGTDGKPFDKRLHSDNPDDCWCWDTKPLTFWQNIKYHIIWWKK